MRNSAGVALNELLLKPGERGTLTGPTGCGKSTIAQLIVQQTPGRCCIVDPKRLFVTKRSHMNELKLDAVISSLADLKLFRPKRFIFRPSEDDLSNMAMYDSIYEWCYRQGNILVYTDDMLGVLPKGTDLKWLQRCYQMGRQHKVTMLSTVQRPHWFPLYLYSESTKYYTFGLRLKADIQRVQEFMPYNPDLVNPSKAVNPYVFAFFDNRHGTRYTYIPEESLICR